MAKVPAYICKNRHGTYYFRLVLPKNSGNHPSGSRRELRKSLKTDSKKIAIRRARKFRVFVDEHIERMNRMPKELTTDYIKFVNFKGDGVSADEIIIDEGSPEANLAALNVINSSSEQPAQEKVELFSDVVKQYFDDGDIKEWSKSTKRDYKQALDLFTQIIGEKPLSEIKYPEIEQYSDSINKLPARRNVIAKYKNKSLQELINMDIPADDLLDPVTVCNLNRRIKSFFAWCVNKGKITVNYSKAITDPKKKSKANESIFNNYEIEKILNGYIYKGDKPKGAHKWDASKFWMPLLALYTGARREELAQLHTKDVVQDGKCYFIKIDDNTKDKQLKNNASRRLVPVHSNLDKFGFLGFIEELKMSKTTRLFPSLKKSMNGKYGDSYGKHFSNYIKSCGLKDSGKNFHSFRSTFISNLANHGVNREVREKIVGHSGGNVHSDIYTSLKEILPKEIEKLDYKIDMSHISSLLSR